MGPGQLFPLGASKWTAPQVIRYVTCGIRVLCESPLCQLSRWLNSPPSQDQRIVPTAACRSHMLLWWGPSSCEGNRLWVFRPICMAHIAHHLAHHVCWQAIIRTVHRKAAMFSTHASHRDRRIPMLLPDEVEVLLHTQLLFALHPFELSVLSAGHHLPKFPGNRASDFVPRLVQLAPLGTDFSTKLTEMPTMLGQCSLRTAQQHQYSYTGCWCGTTRSREPIWKLSICRRFDGRDAGRAQLRIEKRCCNCLGVTMSFVLLPPLAPTRDDAKRVAELSGWWNGRVATSAMAQHPEISIENGGKLSPICW